MSNILELFQRVVEKYRFVDAVKPDIQSFAVSKAKADLVSVIKRAGDYGFVFGKTASLFFMARRMKVRLSLVQVKIILGAVTVGLIGIITAAAMVIYLNFTTVPEKKAGAAVPERMVSRKGTAVKKRVPSVRKTRKSALGIQPFTGADMAASKRASDLVLKKLQGSLGRKNAVSMTGTGRKKVRRIVTGSVRRLGKTSIITAKVINVSTGKVEFVTSEKSRSEREFARVCNVISGRIFLRVK